MPPTVPVPSPMQPMMTAWAKIVLRTCQRVMATTRSRASSRVCSKHVHGQRVGDGEGPDDQAQHQQAPQPGDHAVGHLVDALAEVGERLEHQPALIAECAEFGLGVGPLPGAALTMK